MPETAAAALEAFLTTYDTAKKYNITSLLAKGKGKEDALLTKMSQVLGCPTYFKIRKAVVSILEAHEPEKKGAAGALLAKHKGNERQIFEKLKAKYAGKTPSAPAAAAATSSESPVKKKQPSPLEAVTEFFKQNSPSESAKAPALVKKYEANPKQLFAALEKKYQKNGFFAAFFKSDQPTAGTQQKSTAERIRAIMTKHDPTKNISTILTKYKGKETQLLQALIKKYGEEQQPPSSISAINWEQRFTNLYKAHEPEKVSNVKTVLQKYKGSELKVWKQLVQKYGPDPTDVDNISKALTEMGVDIPRDDIIQKLKDRAGQETELLSDLKQRYTFPTEAAIHRLYYQHQKPKLHTVDDLLAKHSGKEEALYSLLVTKLGPDSYKIPPSESNWEHRLANLYSVHNTAKLATIPVLLEKYSGQEEQLLKSVLERYGEEPLPCKVDPCRVRLERFFNVYDKDRIASISSLLRKYVDNFDDVIGVLIDKYGPEPLTPEESKVQKELALLLCLQYAPIEFSSFEEDINKERHFENRFVTQLQTRFPEGTDPTPETLPERGKRIYEEIKISEMEVVNRPERTSRWQIEDNQLTEWNDLLQEAYSSNTIAEQACTQRLLNRQTVLEHLKLAYRRWLLFLSNTVSDAVADMKLSIKAKDLSIYDELQTNYWAVTKLNREVLTIEQTAERKRVGSERETARVELFDAHKTKFLSHQKRSAVSARELSYLHETRKEKPSTRVQDRDLTDCQIKRLVRHQRKWAAAPCNVELSPSRRLVYPKLRTLPVSESASPVQESPSPNAKLFAETIQEATSTPQTNLEKELLRRKLL